MSTKLMGVVAVAFASAFLSTGSVAHVAGGALISGNGNSVSSSYEKCVVVADGSYRTKCAPPAPKKVAKPAPAKKKPVATKVTLAGDALFATNSDQLSAAGQATLDEFAARAQQVKLTHIDVVGHADSRGADAYNLDLSVRRAVTVKSYLESKGISPAIIFASGKGETQPVASNDTAEGRAQNRRVDITVSGLK